MYLREVRLSDFGFDKDPVDVNGTLVTLPYGWQVTLLLAEVNDQQFSQLSKLLVATLIDDLSRSRRGLAEVVFSGEEVYEYVQKGALWDNEVAVELGRKLFQKVMNSFNG